MGREEISMATETAASLKTRERIRTLLPNLHLGNWRPGPKNSISDVLGVLVHTQSIHIPQTPSKGAVNTGVTTILPRKDFLGQGTYAGIFRFNGAGEMTGSHFIEETGLLYSPIVITNTFAIGAAHQGVLEYCVNKSREGNNTDRVNWFTLPVVAETFDGYLNDLSQFVVKPEHILRGIENASSDPVPEGNTGGGTAMICHGYKGGTGSSSRIVPGIEGKEYTVAALVQANYGTSRDLRIAGVPVGRLLMEDRKAEKITGGSPSEEPRLKQEGSIIVILATDAPLHPLQLQRLARRASTGLSRAGGYGHNLSGDIFLAFTTAGDIPGLQDLSQTFQPVPFKLEVIDDMSMNGMLEASADAVEEAIYNALCGAKTMVGLDGHRVEALPLGKVKSIMEKALQCRGNL